MIPRTTTDGASDGVFDLGDSNARFKDLYLSGGVFLGGTGADNYLSDYETGNFTPTAFVGTLVNPYGHYTKVGRLVTLVVGGTFPTSSSGGHQGLGSLPFAASAGTNGNGGGFIRFSTFGANQPYLHMNNNANSIGLYTASSAGGTTPAVASGKRLDAVVIYYT